MPKHDKSTAELIRDFIKSIDLKGENTFKRQELYNWFNKNYPDIKRGNLYMQLTKLAVNAPSRKYSSPHPDGSDDILYQIMGTDSFKLYDKTTAVIPSIEIEPDEGKGQEFALEKHLQDFLAKNMSIIEHGLRLYEDEEKNKIGLEYPADGKRIDILALDKNDNFVVIELKVSKGYDKVVGQLLWYKNWIKRNMAESVQNVRGIIICKKITDDLLYACDGLDDIELFEYDLDIKLHKKEIGI